MANSPVNSIQWHKMPWPSACSWYQSSQVRHVTSCVLGALSVGSLGGTYYFSQVSLHPAWTRRLAITSLVMGAFAFILRQIPLSARDPVYILRQRGLIHSNLLTNPHYGYKDMPPGFLNEAEEKILLQADMQNLSYSDFKKKHGSSGLAVAVRINQDQMKRKAFKHVKEKVLSKENDFEAASASCADVLLSDGEKQSLKADCGALLLLQEQGNAQEFIAKADKEFITAITNASAIEYILKDHEKTLNSDEWLSLGWKVIGLASKLPKYRELLQAKFLRLPYERLTDIQYQNERDFLGIDAATIKKALRERWDSISYTDEKFVERKGFLLSIQKEFFPKEWEQKILSDTKHLSVFETARRWPELFEKKILTRGSAASESDTAIWKRLQQEILDCRTWENFIKTCPAALLQTKMIPVDSTAVAFLAMEYVCKYPRSVLGFNPPRYLPKGQKPLDLLSHLPKALQDLKAEIRGKFTDRVQWKAATLEFLKRMMPYQIDIFLRLNDFSAIVKRIEIDAALCRRFAAALYQHRQIKDYATLIGDFVSWVEKTAQGGKLPLIFAWNINIEAGDLFRNKIRFINNGNQLFPINEFVVQALVSDSRNFLSGVIGNQMIEGRTSEVCTTYDNTACEGLMEFYKTGALHQFLKLYQAKEAAITSLWELADQLCLPKLQEVLTQKLDLTVEPPPSNSLNDVIEEVEPEQPSS